ncbi:MAG: hypothetical protein H0V17_28875 [Deltaproteobacteria bacterium]|nr:hypothetical protein [Deltaproteobacteria bacterium]
MKAFMRAAGGDEHALHGPLATSLGVVADHLGGRTRGTYDRIAKLDRERTPGEHAFDRVELLELMIGAHTLLCDPPEPVRKLRRLAAGPHPAARQIGELCDWLRACRDAEVIYDLWRSTHSSISS